MRVWMQAAVLAGVLRGQDTGPFRFEHQFISSDLPLYNGTGDYGQTALVDLDRDGHPDFVLGRKGNPSLLYWFRYEAPDRWSQHLVGRDTKSDVALAAVDADGDGWPDLVCGGVWYRNPGNPGKREFERHVFDPDGGNIHDALVADIDGDGKPDVVTMREGKDGLCWYKIPADPTKPWIKHVIGDGVHGAITPTGAGDLDGDGDLDIVRADTWFENADGKGERWIAHKNVPFGRVGPFGMCVRCAVVDVDGDGRKSLVMCDADIADSKIAVLRNEDGKGGRWSRQDLPQSFVYGSLHSLAVADFNNDGRPDIVSNEQEELLPQGRENPRWILWENLGGGRFKERILLDRRLGGHELQAGDVDGDGWIDLCSKPWGAKAWNGNGGRMHVDFLHNLGGKAK